MGKFSDEFRRCLPKNPGFPRNLVEELTLNEARRLKREVWREEILTVPPDSDGYALWWHLWGHLYAEPGHDECGVADHLVLVRDCARIFGAADKFVFDEMEKRPIARTVAAVESLAGMGVPQAPLSMLLLYCRLMKEWQRRAVEPERRGSQPMPARKEDRLELRRDQVVEVLGKWQTLVEDGRNWGGRLDTVRLPNTAIWLGVNGDRITRAFQRLLRMLEADMPPARMSVAASKRARKQSLPGSGTRDHHPPVLLARRGTRLGFGEKTLAREDRRPCSSGPPFRRLGHAVLGRCPARGSGPGKQSQESVTPT